MKKLGVFFFIGVFSCVGIAAQSYDSEIDAMGELAVLTENDWREKEDVLHLADYFVHGWSDMEKFFSSNSDEYILEEVLTYRELPTHTMDDFDAMPYFYDLLGDFEADDEWEERDLMALTDVALDKEDLEYRAIHSIIAPPCGGREMSIYYTDVDVPYYTPICELPIRSNEPYLLEMRSDRSVHLRAARHFGVEVDDLVPTGEYSVFKGSQYEDVSVHFDTFDLQPVTVKVYDKWGRVVETKEGNTGESVHLNCSEYWWGMHWVGIYLTESESLLLKQLYLAE